MVVPTDEELAIAVQSVAVSNILGKAAAAEYAQRTKIAQEAIVQAASEKNQHASQEPQIEALMGSVCVVSLDCACGSFHCG